MKLDLRPGYETGYSVVYSEIIKAKTPIVVVYGDSGSSKSYSAHQNELLQLTKEEKGETLVVH